MVFYPHKLIINDKYFCSERNENYSKFSINQITNCKKICKHYVCYTTTITAIFIPFSAFETPEQIEQFENILKQNKVKGIK